MAKCPKCGKEIAEFNLSAHLLQCGSVVDKGAFYNKNTDKYSDTIKNLSAAANETTRSTTPNSRGNYSGADEPDSGRVIGTLKFKNVPSTISLEKKGNTSSLYIKKKTNTNYIKISNAQQIEFVGTSVYPNTSTPAVKFKYKKEGSSVERTFYVMLRDDPNTSGFGAANNDTLLFDGNYVGNLDKAIRDGICDFRDIRVYNVSTIYDCFGLRNKGDSVYWGTYDLSGGLPVSGWNKDNNGDIYLYMTIKLLKYGMTDTIYCKGWHKLNMSTEEFSLDPNIVFVDHNNENNGFLYNNGVSDGHVENENHDTTSFLDANLEIERERERYEESNIVEDSKYNTQWFKDLYGDEYYTYSLKSHNSIIGLPMKFMKNVDVRPGASLYGKQYLEDIIYDMNIACIKPGGPVLNKSLDSGAEYSDDFISGIASKIGTLKGYLSELDNKGVGGLFKECLFSLIKGTSSRFYSFQSDYTHYTHYVNTLCHLFVTFLGIGDKEYINAMGETKTYAEYTDDYREIEFDKGLGLKKQYGFDNAVYVYYSDAGSSMNQDFQNETMQSGLASTLKEMSDTSKEWGFLINAAGIEKGKGLFSLDGISNTISTYGGNGILGRLLSNASEGATTILAGNNISLPEIYADSSTTMEHSFKIKLASPYGDPESVFLYVLRPLARLLAFSLPRQYTANSYGSPFIVQAFSKGQFNCQLGIVTNLSVTRGGNGGESHTITHLPTELEVNLTIADMYDKIFLSNEYYGNGPVSAILGSIGEQIFGTTMGLATFFSGSTAAKLLYNNIGLIDFAASFCGFNLNSSSWEETGFDTLLHMINNRCHEYLTISSDGKWKFNQWSKKLNDSYNDAVTKLTTPIVTL